jgi:hypothetical protein
MSLKIMKRGDPLVGICVVASDFTQENKTYFTVLNV